MEPIIITLGGAALTALVAAVTALWRQAVAESKRKDALIDRLLNQVGRTANIAERSVSLAAEKERSTR